MTILLVAEHDNESLSDQTHKAMSAAAEIGGDVHILVAGKGCTAVGDGRRCQYRVRRLL
jgi:electron transfer flavoprotein alpha subunit